MNASTPTARRTALALVLALAAVAGVPGSAVAGSHTHATQIAVDGYYGIDGQRVEVYGSVASEETRCVADRRVKVYIEPNEGDPFTQIDTAVTSQNGAWMGYGPTDVFPFAAKAKVTRSTFGPKHHRQVCGSETQALYPFTKAKGNMHPSALRIRND